MLEIKDYQTRLDRASEIRPGDFLDWIDPNVLPFLPQWHYLHIHDEVLPYAREHGVTEEQIATMLTVNPRRLFEQAR